MNIKQTQLQLTSTSNTSFSKYTLLHSNPLLKHIYTTSPISNFLPKHILLFITTPLPSLSAIIYNSIHISSKHTLIITSILLSILIISIIIFIIFYLKHKHSSSLITNPKLKCMFYLIIYISFSISLISFRNSIKETLQHVYKSIKIDFIYNDIEILYAIMWIWCDFCEYVYVLIINGIVLLMKVPFMCLDVNIELVSVCSIIGIHLVNVGMSYGVTYLNKSLFMYERCYKGSRNDIDDVIKELGVGVIDVKWDEKEIVNIKWNDFFQRNEVLKGMLGENGEWFEKVFDDIKEVNEDIEWKGIRKCNSCISGNRNSNLNSVCNSNNTTTRQLNNNINNTSHNNYIHNSTTHINSNQIDLLRQLNLHVSNNNSVTININSYSSSDKPTEPNISPTFNPFLSTLIHHSLKHPSTPIFSLCTCILNLKPKQPQNHILESFTNYLYLKTFYTYNPFSKCIKFIFVDESKSQFDDLFKTYVQQISMYLHDFKNPLITIEEKVKQINDMLNHFVYKNNIPSEIEQHLFNNINFVSLTASDCVCMVRSYETFSKEIISNNNDNEVKLDIISFPLNEIYDYLQEWVNMKLEKNGSDVQFRVNIHNSVSPDFILCTDKMKLKQILMNILSNSIKFTLEGSISLQISRTCINDINYTKFEIEDTGSGMDENIKNNLFKPFISNNKCKSNKHGCGLGMLISLQNSKMLGKEIEVDTVEGRGTRMWFYVEERDIPPSHMSTFSNLNEKMTLPQSKLNRRLFQYSSRDVRNNVKCKKANTLFNNILFPVNPNMHIKKQRKSFVHKSKTLPSTLESSDFAIPKISINEVDVDEKESECNLYTETELYEDPIQILPNHKSIIGKNKVSSTSELGMFKLDKSKTTKGFGNNNSNNDFIRYPNTHDILVSPSKFYSQNAPKTKAVNSPVLSFYKNPLMSPSLNGHVMVNPKYSHFDNNNSNSNSVCSNKKKPLLCSVHTISSSCVAINKFVRKDYLKNCSTFSEANSTSPAFAHLSVLLCDDDESILSAHTRILNERNIHKVDKVNDGLDMLKMFINGELNSYDLILLDYSMCFMDGTDVVKVIRFMKENIIGERCNFNYDILNRITFASGALDIVKDVLNDKQGQFKYYNKPINKRDLKRILKDCGIVK